jgi:Pyruvate/2-oxoacid:ferredoxin oxidoreductase delta subunit
MWNRPVRSKDDANEGKSAMTTSDAIYARFIDWLGKSWWGLPASDSLQPAIRARYTPEDADFLTGFPHSATSLEQLAELKSIDPADLEPRLDELARKGLVYRSRRGSSVRYWLNDAFFTYLRATFWPGRDDPVSRAVAPPINRYFEDGFFDQYATAHAKGLRTVPIHQTVEDPRTVMPYEDVARLLDSFEFYSVSTCCCRHRKDLDPDSEGCDHPKQNCLHFDGLGKYIVESGLGREITRAEAETILQQAADAGLVHGASNWLKPDTICNCCTCCCMWMEGFHRLGHHRSLDPSNYCLRTRPETCKACGLCLKRCPMNAIALEETAEASNKKGAAATVDLELCLGCGVCVHKCPTSSLTLERVAEPVEPPRDVRDYGARFLADRQRGVPLRREG